MLTQKQSRFGFEYCKDYNGTNAAIRAGYSENGASVTGCRLLADPKVQERIAQREEELATEAEVDRAWILKQWRDIAIADPRDLMQLVTRPCRLCWPAGLGFIEDPNPACSDPILTKEGTNMGGCGGRGNSFVKLTDTKKLTGPAARLIASIKETKNGIEIKTRDQDAALLNLAKAIGLIVEKRELSGPGGGPIQTATGAIDFNAMSDAELDAFCQPKGTIEGTLEDSLRNPQTPKQLEAGSSP